jgi:F-type H+-transporting ATPase subunit b
MEFNATFFITAISFIVFVFLMNTILYRPLERIVDEREKLISENYEKAKELNSEAKNLLEKKAFEIAQAKVKAKNYADEEQKKNYDESSKKIRAEKENSLKYINEQKQIMHKESEKFKQDMNANIESFAELIMKKFINKEKGGNNAQ